MSTNIKDAKNAPSSAPMEPGTYPARCCAVVDLGLRATSFEGKERETPQIMLIWEFPTELVEVSGEQKPRWLSKTYTFSINEKAQLRKDLKSWRGVDFTEQELDDFDIAKVLGAPCIVTVSQTKKNGKTYTDISGVSKAMKGVEVPPVTAKYHFDIDRRETWSCFGKLPKWVQEKINDSLTLKRQGVQIGSDGKAVAGGAASGADTGREDVPPPTDDDLPF